MELYGGEEEEERVRDHDLRRKNETRRQSVVGGERVLSQLSEIHN